MTKDITKYVKKCKACQINKPAIDFKEPFLTPTLIKPFEIVIDTVGPLLRSDSQNEYAVTIMCNLTIFNCHTYCKQVHQKCSENIN